MLEYTTEAMVEKLTGMKPVTESPVYLGDEVISHVRSIIDQANLHSPIDGPWREDGYVESAKMRIHSLQELDQDAVNDIVRLFAYIKASEMAMLAMNGSIATCIDIINTNPSNTTSDEVAFAKLNGLSEMEMRFQDVDVKDQSEPAPASYDTHCLLSKEQLDELLEIPTEPSLLADLRSFARRIALDAERVDYDYVDSLDVTLLMCMSADQKNTLMECIPPGASLVRVLEPNEEFLHSLSTLI